MLGRVPPQASLDEARFTHRHLLSPGSFYERLADHGHELVCDDDFAHLYDPDTGRPSVPPSIMLRTLLCAVHDNVCGDREIARRSRVDLDWKAAMGVSAEFPGIAATTFSLFRSRLLVCDDDRAMLDRSLQRAATAKVLDGDRTAIIDSSPVAGAGAVADTYALIRKLLERLVRVAGQRLDDETGAVAAPFIGGKPDIDWQDPAARKQLLGELVAAAAVVREATADLDDAAVVEASGLLGAVIDQDIERDEAGRPQIRRGVAPDRIISHSDPEMRHGRKSSSRRFNGHKLHLVSDENSELIFDVHVGPGNGGDGEQAADAVARVNDTLERVCGSSSRVAILIGDMAYSDGDVRTDVEAAGVELLAKVPDLRNGGRFTKQDFDIDLEAGTVTCPAGNTTATSHACKDNKGRGARRFRFDDDTCRACPLRDQCVKSERGRTVTVGVHHQRIEAARNAQTHDPETVQLLRARAKVERKIDHVQDVGMRKARYRGRRKTTLQARLAATVVNLKRLVALDAWGTTPSRASPQAA